VSLTDDHIQDPDSLLDLQKEIESACDAYLQDQIDGNVKGRLLWG
jgi:hypothetical protein